MSPSDNVHEFVISVDGESSGEKWHGKFKCKKRLSHRDQLTRDKVRRDLLGPDAQNASPRAHNQAEIFSQIAVRLTESPPWWRDSGNGLDLPDDSVIAKVYEEVIKAEADAITALKKDAEEAKAILSGENKKD